VRATILTSSDQFAASLADGRKPFRAALSRAAFAFAAFAAAAESSGAVTLEQAEAATAVAMRAMIRFMESSG
jgi:ABC-type transporter Mla subunit MlaD